MNQITGDELMLQVRGKLNLQSGRCKSCTYLGKEFTDHTAWMSLTSFISTNVDITIDQIKLPAVMEKVMREGRGLSHGSPRACYRYGERVSLLRQGGVTGNPAIRLAPLPAALVPRFSISLPITTMNMHFVNTSERCQR